MEGVEQSDVIEVTSIPGTVDAVTSDYRFQSPTTHNLALDSSRMTGAPVYEASPTSVLYQSRPSQTASFAAARLMEELEEIISPHVTFYESPRTGRPVDRTKKYIKDEPIDFPVEDSILNSSPIIEPVESPTQQEQDAKNSQTHGSVWDGSPVPQDLATPFIAPRISDRNGPTGAKGRGGRAGMIGTKLPKGRFAAEGAEGAHHVPESLSNATRHKRQALPRATKQSSLNYSRRVDAGNDY